MKRRRMPHFAALSPNGKNTHAANIDGQPVCGGTVIATFRFRARITCPGCIRRRPDLARRWANRPLVGRNELEAEHEKFYAKIRTLLNAVSPDHH